MPECPCCYGERTFDFSAMEAPIVRLARVFGIDYEPAGVIPCEVCQGTGEVAEQVARDYAGWATARVDQLLAGIDAGEIVLPL